MADLVKPFSPFFTQGKPGGSEILDRNLLAIKQALEQANVTITKLTNTINVLQTQVTNNTIVTGKQGPPGISGEEAGDGDAAAMAIPGPPGRDGRDGRTLWMPGDTEDVDPFFIPPPPAPIPFTLALGYGPNSFDGTLPSIAEGVPHFWLHPFTCLTNVSALAVGSSHNDMPIEWETGGPYTKASLDVYVRDILLSTAGTGGPIQLTAAISQNGSDTAISVILPSSATNTRYQSIGALSVVDGDKIGVHITANNVGSGSLFAHFFVRLT